MEDLNAQVVAVQPNKIKIHIKKLKIFKSQKKNYA